MSTSLKLRRFELQVQYEPCFTFWNVKSALAERWAHGPDFDQLTDQGNQITLARTSNQIPDDGFAGAIGGIVLSSLIWEMPNSPEAAFELAIEWLDDCLTASKPQKVLRIQALQRWLSPTSNVTNLQERFTKNTQVLRPRYQLAMGLRLLAHPSMQDTKRDHSQGHIWSLNWDC